MSVDVKPGPHVGDKRTVLSLRTLYSVMVLVFSKILFVTPSGAGPPLDTLYLIPKSLFGPPGL